VSQSGSWSLVGLKDDGGEDQRIGGRGGYGFGEFDLGKVGAEGVEGFRGEEEGRVVRHVRGVDPGLDPGSLQVGEGGVVEEGVVQGAAEGVAAVHSAGDALGDGQGVEAGGGHPGFGVLGQEGLAEALEAFRAFQAELRGHDRAAGDAGDEANVVEKAVRGAGLGGLEFLEHAVGEGRGAHAAAGEGEAYVEVIPRCFRGQGRVFALEGLVLRLVPGGAAEHQEKG
jgi:hypothetical protein